MKVKELKEILKEVDEEKELAIATLDTDMENVTYSRFEKVVNVIPKMSNKVVKNLMPFEKELADYVIISTHKNLHR